MTAVTRAVLLLAVAFAAACGGGGTPQVALYENPVHAADFPDPFVLRIDDTWYAYGTTSGGKEVQTMTSPDLVEWTPGPDALPEVGKWAYPGKTWAPEVLARDDGTFVLFYTANGGSQCIGRAVAEEPLGPFVDRWDEPLVCQRTEGGSIDPSPFRAPDGSLYLYWKNDGNALGQTTWIYGQRLSTDGTELVGEPVRLLQNDEGWEAGVVEAPTMWEHGGRLYLFYSGNDFQSDFYAVGYAACDAPLGPCTDAGENPILESDCDAAGPGHQTLVRAGGATWMLYHSWPVGGSREMRTLWLDRVEWRGGKPVVLGPNCWPQEAP